MYCSESYSCVFVSGIECSLYNWAYAILKTGKVKLAPVHAIKAYGELAVRVHLFLASRLDRGEWLASYACCKCYRLS